MTQSDKRDFLIKGLLIIIFGILVTAVGFKFYQNETQFNAKYTTTTGYVTDIVVTKNKVNGCVPILVNEYLTIFEYTVDGKTYELSVTLSKDEKLEIGDSATIYYHPEAPEHSKFRLTGTNNLLLLWLGIIILIGGISKALKGFFPKFSSIFYGVNLVCSAIFYFIFIPLSLAHIVAIFLGLIGIAEIHHALTSVPPRPEPYRKKMSLNKFLELKKIEKVRKDFDNERLTHTAHVISSAFFMVYILQLFYQPHNSSIFKSGIIFFYTIVVIIAIAYTIYLIKHFKQDIFHFVFSAIGTVMIIVGTIMLILYYPTYDEDSSLSTDVSSEVENIVEETESSIEEPSSNKVHEVTINGKTYSFTYPSWKYESTDEEETTTDYSENKTKETKKNQSVPSAVVILLGLGMYLYLAGPIYAVQDIDNIINAKKRLNK